MKSIVISIILLYSSLAFSSGWHDYKLDISDDLSIFKTNSFQVCLGRPDNSLLLCPDMEKPNFGPIKAYALTDRHVFTEHYGAKAHEKNASIQTADPDIQLFFITERVSGISIGPLSYDEFLRSKNVGSDLEWVSPKNPNKWEPFLGNVYVVCFMILFFGWPFFLVGLFSYIFYKIWKGRRNA